MTDATIASTKPYYKQLKKGRTYLWCSCGLSKRQPFCDGRHTGTSFEPISYTAAADNEEVLFCGCKKTCEQPFCDGSHNNIPGAYEEDDPTSPENLAVPLSTESDGARSLLNGDCYVFSTADAALDQNGDLKYCTVIAAPFGAKYQSQFYAELAPGKTSPVITFGDRHTVLFISEGTGHVSIAGKSFAIGRNDGVYICPDEPFALTADANTMKIFISACPVADDIGWAAAMTDTFNTALPDRVVPVDPAKRHAMAARFFQMLVDKTVGSTVATQFIGHIPISKGAPHRHLYEEALIILSGEGCLWTEDRKTPVKSGDVVFLPAKQIHSLQCTADSGMDVVGVIYPGDNPSINY